MLPGEHLWHVSMHFLYIFLSSHLPFFFSFLHFLLEILSMQSILWINFVFSEIKIEETSFRYVIQDSLEIIMQKNNQKYLDESWLWNWLLNVRFRLFLTNCLKVSECKTKKKYFSRSDFRAKIYWVYYGIIRPVCQK